MAKSATKERKKVPPKKVAKDPPKKKKKSTALVPAKRRRIVRPRTYEPKDTAWWSPRREEIVRDLYAKKATDEMFFVYRSVCQALNLSPLAHHIYCVVRYSDKEKRDVMAIQIGINGYRLIAERTKKYRGRTLPLFCGEDGEWKEVWAAGKGLVAAKVGVRRADTNEAVYNVAHLEEFYDPKSPIWKSMPRNQLAKCAEAGALRAGFPQEFAGTYIHEELPHSGQVRPKEIEEKVVENHEVKLQAAIKRFYFVGGQAGFSKGKLERELKKKYKVKSHNDVSLEQFKEATKALASQANAKLTRRGKAEEEEQNGEGNKQADAEGEAATSNA